MNNTSMEVGKVDWGGSDKNTIQCRIIVKCFLVFISM